MSQDESYLRHYGILGMRWGHRKDEYPGVAKGVQRTAKKDAKRHVEAKMFYGETAGTRRKLLKAEIDKKIKKLPGYKEVFESEIAKVDTKKAADKAVRERVTIDTVDKGRRLIKNVLNVTGPLSVAIVSVIYYKNKERVDKFVSDQFQRVINGR